MSYCVNCGVELEASEKRCPLCNTIVLNPNTFGLEEKSEIKTKNYESVSKLHMDFRFMATVISILLLIPLFVTVICNIVGSGKLTWSLYVIGAIVMVFVCALLPAFFKKKNPYLLEITDACAIFLYLCLISFLCKSSFIFTIALPMCLLTLVTAMLFTMVIRSKKASTLLKSAVFTVFAGLYSLATELIINLRFFKAFALHWSQYVLIPCAVVGLVIVFIDSQKKLKEELRKRLFM